jgi:hypothetical protein
VNEQIATFIQDRLSTYFSTIRAERPGPKMMLTAIEGILANKEFENTGLFLVLREMKTHDDAAQEYCHMAINFIATTKSRIWRLEGNAMRRWGRHRQSDFTLHEVFWGAFMEYYAFGTGGRITSLLEYVPGGVISPQEAFHLAARADANHMRAQVLQGMELVLDAFNRF